MNESILVSIKKLLGIEHDYTPFDTDITILINSEFMTLTQLGVGPSEGFSIQDSSKTWADFLPDANETIRNAVKEYIYMKVKMIFDPPGNSYVMEAMKDRCAEYEQRLIMQVESTKQFSFVNYENNPRIQC